MDRFVVGSGRCGSTLLSRMLAENRGVLSLFEFFNGLDFASRFATEPMSGAEFAALLSGEQGFVTGVVRRGYRVEEISYPYERGRYSRDEALPWILVSMLPRLTNDPDGLYDALMAAARALPSAPPVEHYRALFAWLAGRLGRTAWVERSGSSIDYAGDLARHFPEARFVHLHRDGREVALSMREHAPYRLVVALMYREPGEPEVPLSELGAAPREGDALGAILASRPPVERFGRYWNDQLQRGLDGLADVAPERVLEVCFEELVDEPHRPLRAIEAFFELPADAGWVERAAALVRGVPAIRFGMLAEAEQEALSAACRPGRARLARGS